MIDVKRVSKNQYYLNIAKEVSERATCMSAHFGAIIVRDDQIVSTGYNGAPRGTKDCYELGNCLRRKLGVKSGTQYEMCRSVHAEQNAIINAARAGVSLLGGTMYLFGKRVWDGADELIKAYPCFICKKMILNAGINKMIVNDEDGDIIEFSVEEWTEQWAKNDMIEDTEKYVTSYKGEDGKELSAEADEDCAAKVSSGGGCCGGGCCG